MLGAVRYKVDTDTDTDTDTDNIKTDKEQNTYCKAVCIAKEVLGAVRYLVETESM